MERIVLTGVAPYDGEYEIDFEFNNAELHTIKRVAGIRAGEFNEALEKGDNDLNVAIAIIALQQAGKPVEEERIWQAKPGFLSIEDDVEADPTEPQAQKPATPSSGDASKVSSDPQANGQKPTGSQHSETPRLDLVSGQAI